MPATYTTNFNLSKDSEDDRYDVTRVNSNTDIIDAQLARSAIKLSVDSSNVALSNVTGPALKITNSNETTATVTLTYNSITLSPEEISTGESHTWQINSTDATNVSIAATATVTIEYYAHNKTYVDDLANTKVDKIDGKGLSANNLTDALKAHYDAAYEHGQVTTGNPHGVTKADLSLDNVDNTADADKPVSTATQAALNDKVSKIEGKGLSTNDFTNELKEHYDEMYEDYIKEFELIESIEFSDNSIKSLVRTQEPDGTLYNFSKVYVECETPTADVNDSAYMGINAESYLCAYFQYFVSTSVSGGMSKLLAEIKNGFLTASSWNGINKLGTRSSPVSYRDGFCFKASTIDRIFISSHSAIPAGSTIKIYAVRR